VPLNRYLSYKIIIVIIIIIIIGVKSENEHWYEHEPK